LAPFQLPLFGNSVNGLVFAGGGRSGPADGLGGRLPSFSFSRCGRITGPSAKAGSHADPAPATQFRDLGHDRFGRPRQQFSGAAGGSSTGGFGRAWRSNPGGGGASPASITGCPLSPRKRTSEPCSVMSALGQNLTWPVACQTSLLPRSLRGEISLSGSRDRPVRAPGLAARSRATSRATNSRLVTTLVYCTGNMTCS
jgi:hypothetical protein